MENEEKLIKKILVALDGSSYANQVAKYGGDIALRYNAEITLIHVVEPPRSIIPVSEIDTGLAAEMEFLEKLTKKMELNAENMLNGYKKEMKDKGLNVKTRVEKGNPSDIILTIAEDENYDLIVVGSRGLGNLKRFILGSVSDKISKHAHCPVLIVR
ncbi:MAG: universal stress protein [Candidatus Jordarchaeaceae archaeon]